jgi:hypothetical protein
VTWSIVDSVSAALREVISLHKDKTMALKGFDMVWAITQNTINSQMEWLQESGVIAKSLAFGDLENDGAKIGGDGADAAMLAPPTVSFDTGQGNVVRLMLAFTGGTFTAYSGFGKAAVPKSYPLQGCMVAFKVNLAIGQLAHEHLANDQAIPPEVAKILTAFDPSMFDVQSIFMDFQNSDLTTYDTTYSQMNFPDETTKVVFGQAMASWINSHRGNDNPFILGHSVTRTTPTEPGTPSILEPTGANFSSRVFAPITGPDDPNAGLNTFNFLMVTNGRKILDDPALYGNGAGVFDYNLVDNNAIDGRGYINFETFLNTYVGPMIIDPLNQALVAMPDYAHARDDRGPNLDQNAKSNPGPDGRARFARTPTGWTYQDDVDLSWHESGFNSHDRQSQQHMDFTVAVKMAPDDVGVDRLTIQIDGSLYRYEWDQLNTDIPPFKSNVYVGKAHASARLPYTIKLQFVASDDGKLAIKKTASSGEIQKESGVDGAYKLADVFSADSISHDWNDNSVALSSVLGLLSKAVDDEAGNVIAAAATKIVMPAPKTFFYKNILIGQHGDIEIDLTYKAA